MFGYQLLPIMKIIILVVFLFGMAWARPQFSLTPEFKRSYVHPLIDIPQDFSPRITNGTEAVPNSIPFQVYLQIETLSSSWFCGGSLISQKYVLTAAHCLTNALFVVVHLGVHNRNAEEEHAVTLSSVDLKVHEKFDASSLTNDLALVGLPSAVELNEYIQVVKLPSKSDQSTFAGDNVQVSGWGDTTGYDNYSDTLRVVNTTVLSSEECRTYYPSVPDDQICTLGEVGRGSCEGDSGGPLVDGDTLIGVVSYGVTHCLAGYPSVFSRVSSFLPWIEENSDLTL